MWWTRKNNALDIIKHLKNINININVNVSGTVNVQKRGNSVEDDQSQHTKYTISNVKKTNSETNSETNSGVYSDIIPNLSKLKIPKVGFGEEDNSPQ